MKSKDDKQLFQQNKVTLDLEPLFILHGCKLVILQGVSKYMWRFIPYVPAHTPPPSAFHLNLSHFHNSLPSPGYSGMNTRPGSFSKEKVAVKKEKTLTDRPSQSTVNRHFYLAIEKHSPRDNWWCGEMPTVKLFLFKNEKKYPQTFYLQMIRLWVGVFIWFIIFCTMNGYNIIMGSA